MTELLPKTGRYHFLAEPFHCDFTHQLLMGHLGNHMINAADFHSNDRGYGMNYLNTIHKTWVLSRLSIEMAEMPVAYDRFIVETWVDNVVKFFTSRNFAVIAEDGHVYGYGRSIWAMIDTETREPTDILAVRDGLISQYVDSEKLCPIDKVSRVKMECHTDAIRTLPTHYSDIDINGHVNSVKYIEHVLDLWDLDWYRSHRLQRFDIAYVAESHYGDTLKFFMEEDGTDTFCVRIMKYATDGDEGIEVCRCKVKFVKE